MLRVILLAHLSTGVEVFSMKLIIFSFTFTDLDLRANVILFTKDLTPLPSPELLSESPWIRKVQTLASENPTGDTIGVIRGGIESRNSASTYISRAEAAVRAWSADDPVDVRRVQTFHVHVHQMLLKS